MWAGKGTRAGVPTLTERVVGDGLELVLLNVYTKNSMRPYLGHILVISSGETRIGREP